ncbi:unnamed protein product [Paramecium pentaurelia]|uniref:Fructose-1-6-bisphosphatase class I N-terminal domain-containing protein n=1 Tax=Paramecium pentaurelia TaxID=43138 RepID=A0A8S1UHN2_9CILI|nr:unnamed protein product [Paramecium pentaurelia]
MHYIINQYYVKLREDPELSANSYVLRFCSVGGDYANTQNDFGDHYLEMDIQFELNINTQLKKTGYVSYAASKETTKIKLLYEDGKYIVTFDLMDRSSIIGTNFAVGTIFAVWEQMKIY